MGRWDTVWTRSSVALWREEEVKELQNRLRTFASAIRGKRVACKRCMAERRGEEREFAAYMRRIVDRIKSLGVKENLLVNRPQRNHNPLNLRFASQHESTGADPESFAVFSDDPAGWRAAHAQIRLDQSRNLTLGAFLRKFAPANENDSDRYIRFACSELRVPAERPLDMVSAYALAGVMAQMEGYYAALEGQTDPGAAG
jgi:hypothetical protein